MIELVAPKFALNGNLKNVGQDMMDTSCNIHKKRVLNAT